MKRAHVCASDTERARRLVHALVGAKSEETVRVIARELASMREEIATVLELRIARHYAIKRRAGE